jgi:hypothetical protein
MMPFCCCSCLQSGGVASIVVGDHNYGEGSSREHAAMEPRFLECRWLNHLLVSTRQTLKTRIVRIDIR